MLYASEPLPLPPPLAALLAGGAVVALHSGEAARHFAALCTHRGLDRARIALAAMGRAWRRRPNRLGRAGRHPRPDDDALLALARRICQEQAKN